MDDLYRSRIYPLLSRLDPERSHRLALHALGLTAQLPVGDRLLRKLAQPTDGRLTISCFGLTFPNPIGVAAGLDKDAEAIGALFALGFGSVEIGTVTPRPQPGNPPPRLWRLPDDDALINALGFPSQGAARVRTRLVGRRFSGIVGVNLGKNKETPAEDAAEDYAAVLTALWDVADYFTVNVSSPNTPGLRDLQRREALTGILQEVNKANRLIAQLQGRTVRPVLVKIAPDLDESGLDEVLAGTSDGGASGIIVANTTTSRDGLGTPVPNLPGGLSGRPLRGRAIELVRVVYRQTGGRLPIVGVGGISSADDVIERMRAGASLIQLYTGFVYGGPGLAARLTREIGAYLEREGLTSVSQLVGLDA